MKTWKQHYCQEMIQGAVWANTVTSGGIFGHFHAFSYVEGVGELTLAVEFAEIAVLDAVEAADGLVP